MIKNMKFLKKTEKNVFLGSEMTEIGGGRGGRGGYRQITGWFRRVILGYPPPPEGSKNSKILKNHPDLLRNFLKI
jgi:hypothetical protein